MSNNNSTAKKIWLDSGVGKIETIEILNLLTTEGFCFVRNSRCDIIYSINNPEVAFIDLIAKYEENLLEKEATMENLIKLYKTKKSRFRIKHS